MTAFPTGATTSYPPTAGVTPTVGNRMYAIIQTSGTVLSLGAGWTQIDALLSGSITYIAAYRDVVAGDTTSNIPAIATSAGGTAAVHYWELSGGDTTVAHGTGVGATATVAAAATPSAANSIILMSAFRTASIAQAMTTPPTTSPSLTVTTDQAGVGGVGTGADAAAAHASDSTTSALTVTWTQPTTNTPTMRVITLSVPPAAIIAQVPYQPNYQRAPLLAQ